MRLTDVWGPLCETEVESPVSLPWCSRYAGGRMPTLAQMTPLSEGLSGHSCSFWKGGSGRQGDAPAESIASGFAVEATVVLSAEEFAGFGVDGDAFAVGPVVFREAEAITTGLKGGDGFRGEAVLEE